eukprot:scaffold72370_cov81-Phaeocystis_antarctica.AAC.3
MAQAVGASKHESNLVYEELAGLVGAVRRVTEAPQVDWRDATCIGKHTHKRVFDRKAAVATTIVLTEDQGGCLVAQDVAATRAVRRICWQWVVGGLDGPLGKVRWEPIRVPQVLTREVCSDHLCGRNHAASIEAGQRLTLDPWRRVSHEPLPQAAHVNDAVVVCLEEQVERCVHQSPTQCLHSLEDETTVPFPHRTERDGVAHDTIERQVVRFLLLACPSSTKDIEIPPRHQLATVVRRVPRKPEPRGALPFTTACVAPLGQNQNKQRHVARRRGVVSALRRKSMRRVDGPRNQGQIDQRAVASAPMHGVAFGTVVREL